MPPLSQTKHIIACRIASHSRYLDSRHLFLLPLHLINGHLGKESNQSGWPSVRFAMGAIEIFLCVFAGHFIAVHSVMNEQDVAFTQDFPGLVENLIPFPFRRNFDFTPYDTIFSSWRTRSPDFHMLGDLPPIMNIPKVEVFCDESNLTVLVGKRSNGVMLTGEEMQLGDGCYSNRELPNQFVFIYGLDECGTTRVVS